MSYRWNPWHGCHKITPGCQNCYVYSIDEGYGKNGGDIGKNKDFSAPISKDRNGSYRFHSGETVQTCFTSDFLLEEADDWRADAWKIIKLRSDLSFFFITKRISRFKECIPSDWGDGYPNVTVGCTVEDQARAEERLPIFLKAPIRKKLIICAPLLEKIDLSGFLCDWVDELSVGGESGKNARICDYDWVLSLREQAVNAGVSFTFHQTGSNFIKDGVLYKIPRQMQLEQAKKAEIDWKK